MDIRVEQIRAFAYIGAKVDGGLCHAELLDLEHVRLHHFRYRWPGRK